ncbi:uncharacterized protein [Parasteatoda tepidariorum]|uniref:uncharacterized protein n=1 Tax=Parasteatoda tepidariorum TaxID=114398 RepID=UPI00077FC289|nr:uncharacterized protein LOC107455230 [Parasteatoda tepidariorum]
MEAVHLIFAILSLFCLSKISAVEYSQLVNMGINCPSSISCDAIGRANFTRRNCECDRNCATYQDCCVDARSSSTSQNRRSATYSCMPFGNIPHMGAYVIQTCSRNYNGPAEMQRRCQDHNNQSDPLMSAPVTDTVSQISYRNRYCAECNNVDMSNAQSWVIQMICDFTSNVNANNSFIYRNIYYVPTSNEWKVDVNGRSYKCNLKYDIPAYLQNKVRLCRSNVISSCASTWTRKRVQRECESYTAIMYVKGSDKVYKNPHCALCNHVTVDALACTPGESAGKRKPFSFTLLMDWNLSNEGEVVGVSSGSCGSNQKYDPYAKKCRNLVCSLPGYEMINGKCKKP